MKRRFHRGWIARALALSGGSVFSGIGFTRNGLGGACQPLNFFGNGVLCMTDFCFLLDCQNGFAGGVIQPCSGLNPTFIDCFGPSGPGTGGTGTGTGTTPGTGTNPGTTPGTGTGTGTGTGS